jgi:hypothetical protein
MVFNTITLTLQGPNEKGHKKQIKIDQSYKEKNEQQEHHCKSKV